MEMTVEGLRRAIMEVISTCNDAKALDSILRVAIATAIKHAG